MWLTALQERKLFDERFIRLDTRRLCELTSAADALGMKNLVDLTSRALARMIEGKTPEEIRETFHLPDDLTGALPLRA
jgi:S-phase kinase-associated protein 1